ncbi:MAG: alpha/beta hydrolase [Polyangiaceae bacterium]
MSFDIEAQRQATLTLMQLPHGVLRALVGAPVSSPEGFLLDPQVQAILRLSDALGHGSWARLGLEKARAGMESEAQILQARPQGALSIHDVVIRVEGGAIRARVYRPAEATGPLPVIVFYHGGGFVLGSLKSHDGECRELSLSVHAVVVAVDYRLAPEHKFPTPVNDAIAAYEWVAENAASIGGDPAKMAVMGDSAGGNLSAVVARELRHHPRKPVFQLLVYPCTDMTRSKPSHRYFQEGFFLTKESIDWFLGAYLRSPDQETDPRASPLLAGNHQGLCPAYIVTAGFDALRDEGRAYAEALAEAGVRVKHRCVEGQIHGFFSMTGGLKSARVALDEMIAALRAELHGT